MKILYRYAVLLLPLLAFAAKVENRKIVADKRTSTVTYGMKHPMHAWEGICRDVNAVVLISNTTRAIEQVAVSLRADSFNSGNANRDSHALEVLEGLKFPKITFASTKIKTTTDIVSVEGNLTFHGITKQVTLIASREDFVNKMVIDGKFDVSLTDFKVERPSLIGMKTDDIIHLKFQLIFNI